MHDVVRGFDTGGEGRVSLRRLGVGRGASRRAPSSLFPLVFVFGTGVDHEAAAAVVRVEAELPLGAATAVEEESGEYEESEEGNGGNGDSCDYCGAVGVQM